MKTGKLTNLNRLFNISMVMLVLASTHSATADASTAQTTFQVTATVLSYCTISANALAFGSYNQSQLAAASTVTVACTLGTTYNVGLDVGLGTGATVASRKMQFGANLLNYGLYSDAGHSTVWGPTIGTNTVTGTGNGLAQNLSVYGLIPAAQYVAPGAYADTITATVTY